MIDFELVKEEDKQNIISKILNNNFFETWDEYLAYLKCEVEFIISHSQNEHKIYSALSLAINHGIYNLDLSVITETTLKVLLKTENRNPKYLNKYPYNYNMHSIKYKIFQNFLNEDKKDCEIISENIWLDLSESVIHINTLEKLQKVYKFNSIDAIIIVDDLKKILSSYKNALKMELNGSLYVFSGTEYEYDNLDFKLTNTSAGAKIRFFLDDLLYKSDIKDIKELQKLANYIYHRVTINNTIEDTYNNKWSLFNTKLSIYTPQMTKNVEFRDIIPNNMEY